MCLNLENFDPSLESLKNLRFNGLLLIKVFNIWAYRGATRRDGGDVRGKIIRGIIREDVMTLKGDATFKEKLTVGLKNDIRNFVNLHVSSPKSKNFYPYKVLDGKVQKSTEDTSR